ncbi:hypothetical protein GCM10009304_21800 [Pseudomonas matsuisoli]|uniref:Phosphatidic acid phosphatase type 2/haloperoxidase domain-containing protein n=1 Tax=Pseudomonas matsuisoli TaxID=1515666 RepID=A0A917PW09_9PSED|nr:hypothetical protein GCM10009304_21800 [Pseudomonas matsuisoli]
MALALLGSWLWSPSNGLWNLLDVEAFHLLNGSLGQVRAWDLFWALASTRVFDVLVGGMMLCLLIREDWIFPRAGVRHALFTFLGVLLTVLVIRIIVTKVGEHLGWQHASPSMQIASTVHLSDQFPMLERIGEVKDRSSKSFPGDHATVLLAWGLFMMMFCEGRRRVAILALALFLCLPRLVAGAHWFSDDFASGMAIALLGLAWGYCTPLAAGVAMLLEWLARPFIAVALHIPGVRRIAVFQR